ncbi:MAG: flavin reductase family protein [Parasphingorhabdus sp.]
MDKQNDFRAALGTFATGVTIVTTMSETGEPIGVTASSFNSVSLDPPLVLWSLAKSSSSMNAFCKSGHFNIHVLSASQEDLSNSFARSGAEKFADVAWAPGVMGSPILENYSALFQCKMMHEYEGGDHVILVGEVIEFDRKDHAPLLFHGGRYAESRPKIKNEAGESVDITEGRFTEDFLLYLVSRAHFQSSLPTREKFEKLGLTQTEYMVLAILSMIAPADTTEISDRLDHTGLAPSELELQSMIENGLLLNNNGQFELSPTGQSHLIETLEVAKAFEDDLMQHFTDSEIADAKHVLKKIIELTGSDIPLGMA